MSENDKNSIPEPLDSNVSGIQKIAKNAVKIPKGIQSETGLRTLPESFEALASIDPKYLGGISQSVMSVAIVEYLHHEVENFKKELKESKNIIELLNNHNSQQNTEIEVLKNKIETSKVIKKASVIFNVIGAGILGIGINMYGNNAFGNYPFLFAVIGAVLMLISWFNFPFGKEK